MSKAIFVFLVNILVATLLSTQLNAQDDLKRIRSLIDKIPIITVANKSQNEFEQIIDPSSSKGFSGTGNNRIELFEESRRLSRVFEKYVAFNPNADALYVGSLIQGNSLKGVLAPITTARAPLTITVTDLVTYSPNGSYSRKVQSPSLKTVTAAQNFILRQKLDTSQIAKISYSQTDFTSIESAFLKLGASYKSFLANVEGSFATNSLKFQTRYMARFVQSYYTVSCEAPSSPTSFFSKSAKFADLNNYVYLPDNPPTYISSITYGRELWILLESNFSNEQVSSALNAAFGIGFASGKVDLNSEQIKTLSQSTSQIFIMGGPAKSAVEVIAGDPSNKIREFYRQGAVFSQGSQGVPISYTIRNLKDNSAAKISFTSDYKITNSRPSPESPVLTELFVTWVTRFPDSKRWNTQANVIVVDKANRQIGSIACCSADRDKDGWKRNQVETRPMDILIKGITLKDLQGGGFVAFKKSNGINSWTYNCIVTFKFSDGYSFSKECFANNDCNAPL